MWGLVISPVQQGSPPNLQKWRLGSLKDCGFSADHIRGGWHWTFVKWAGWVLKLEFDILSNILVVFSQGAEIHFISEIFPEYKTWDINL